MTSSRHVSRRGPDGLRVREGPHLGRLRITPTRVILLVAVVGSVVYLAYAITGGVAEQIPMLASGAAVLGIVFTALTITGAAATIRAARSDQAARSVVAAILGGIAGVIAFGCFAAAVVFALLWSIA